MAKKQTAECSISFEESFEKLEQIVRQLEDGQLGLSESLARYEEGIRYLKQCHQALSAAERKIELLTSVDENGCAETEPLDEESAVESKNVARSSRRRERPIPPSDTQPGDVDTQRGLF